MSTNLIEVLKRHPELRFLSNVLNVGIATKWKDGRDTGTPSIVVYVSTKKSLRSLKKAERIPSEIEGIPVDVIELSTNDYKLSDTKPSRLPLEAQKRIAGGVKR
jgi:hypothetical protein